MSGKQKVPYDTILERWKANGEDKAATAEELDVSKRTVSHALNHFGIRQRVTHTKSMVVVCRDQVRSMYLDRKMSTSEIAKELGSSPESVRQAMIQAGIERRKRGSQEGEKNQSWNGGKTIDKSGYVLVRLPGHPTANYNGYVREHRLVMERVLGRPLLPSEVVHHKDGCRSNNDPSNLELFPSNASHLKHELTGRVPNWTEEGKRRIGGGLRQKRQQPGH